MRRFASLVCIPVLAQAPAAPSPAQVIAKAHSEIEAQIKSYRAHIETGQPRGSFRWDFSRQLSEVERDLGGNPASPTRQALQVARLAYRSAGHLELSPTEFGDVRQAVPPTSEAWSILPSLVLKLAASPEDRQGQDFIAQVRDHNPVPELRAFLLKAQLEDALEAKDVEVWQSALGRLQKDHAGSPELLAAQRSIRLNKLTLVGTQAPSFEVSSLADARQPLTLQGFRGKFLLVDFWATWCPDCRVELPGMRAAWQRFQGRNLAFLSLSFDQKPEIVQAFLAKPENAMPWNHAFLEGAWKHPLASTFGVVGIPKVLLIGPDGRILATDGELRGGRLESTLERLLPQASTPKGAH